MIRLASAHYKREKASLITGCLFMWMVSVPPRCVNLEGRDGTAKSGSQRARRFTRAHGKKNLPSMRIERMIFSFHRINTSETLYHLANRACWTGCHSATLFRFMWRSGLHRTSERTTRRTPTHIKWAAQFKDPTADNRRRAAENTVAEETLIKGCEWRLE